MKLSLTSKLQLTVTATPKYVSCYTPEITCPRLASKRERVGRLLCSSVKLKVFQAAS